MESNDRVSLRMLGPGMVVEVFSSGSVEGKDVSSRPGLP